MSAIGTASHIVICPEGVWDTRAPFFAFNEQNRQENETYYALLLGIEKLCEEIDNCDKQLAASEFFKSGGPLARRVRKSFSRSQPQIAPDQRYKPSVDDLRKIFKNNCIPAVTEYAIVSHCGLFESFMQCWALNFLLAKLEMAIEWTPAEAKLASWFWPYSSYIPGFPEIYKAIPIVRTTLMSLPHLWENPATGQEINKPTTSRLNAFTAINFWREWRNLLVHGSGVVSDNFAEKHRQFWKDFGALYRHVRPPKSGQPLWLNDSTFRPITTTHGRAAEGLRKILVEISKGKRGHAWAPGPPREGWYPRSELPDGRPGVLLMPCDHAPSYQWATDADAKKRMEPALKQAFKELNEQRGNRAVAIPLQQTRVSTAVGAITRLR
jgi:hypothetical protein